jgi:hypothetical protein
MLSRRPLQDQQQLAATLGGLHNALMRQDPEFAWVDTMT